MSYCRSQQKTLRVLSIRGAEKLRFPAGAAFLCTSRTTLEEDVRLTVKRSLSTLDGQNPFRTTSETLE